MPGAICRLSGFMGQAYAAGSAPSSPAANSKAGKHPTTNLEHPTPSDAPARPHWMLVVGGSMLDFSFIPFTPSRRATEGSRHAEKTISRLTALQCGLANGK